MTTHDLTRFDVELVGCDDVTTATVQLSTEQAEFLSDLAAQVNANSEVGCQPRLKIHPHQHDDDCPEDHR